MTPPVSSPVVLLVQPNDDSLQMYIEFLQAKGLQPLAVSNPDDALTLAPKAAVIVTGILLPGSMDGVELVVRLRNDERTRLTPIIVLTACAWRTERERAEHAGCDVFLPKPCLPEELLREIRRLLASLKLGDVRGPVKNERVERSRNRTRRTK